MNKNITKKQVREWLQKKREKYQGEYIDAEERNDDDAMLSAQGKEETIDEIESLLDEID